MIQVRVARGVAARIAQGEIGIARDGGVEQLQPHALVFADVKHRRGIGRGRAEIPRPARHRAIAEKIVARRARRATGIAVGIGVAEDVVFAVLNQRVETEIGAVVNLAHIAVGEADVRHDQLKSVIGRRQDIRRDQRRLVRIVDDNRPIHPAERRRAGNHVRVIPKKPRARDDETVGVGLPVEDRILRHCRAVTVVVQLNAVPVDRRAFGVVRELVFEMADDGLADGGLDERRGNLRRRTAATRRVVPVNQHAHVGAVDAHRVVRRGEIKFIGQRRAGADVGHLVNGVGLQCRRRGRCEKKCRPCQRGC